MTTSTHAAATDKAEKKECKKKKREASENGHNHEEEEETPAPAAEEEEVDEEAAAAAAAAAEKKARKKAKKEAKRLAKLGGAATTNGDVGAAEEEEEAEEEVGEEVSKEEKKRRKKEKKRQEKEASSSSTVPSTPSSSSPSSSSGIISQTEAQAWWEKHEILVSGPGCELFLPTLTFAGANFPTDLLACTNGFTTPTPIQAQCWPVLMGGRDIIGIAETGSGKTLTFALPGLVHIRAKVKEGGGKGGRQQHVPRMLVVAPTRELAMQSAEVLEGVLSGLDLRNTCLFGGVNKHEQRQALRQGVDIVVATPGRLADLMEEGECDLSQVSYLVLDEADRMLDQGFEQAIRGIILECAPAEKRQTALFSATWPQSIQTLAREFLREPVKVTIGGEDLSSNKRVKQVVEVVGEFDREKRLRALLQQYHGKRDNRVLVFALYKKVRACSWAGSLYVYIFHVFYNFLHLFSSTVPSLTNPVMPPSLPPSLLLSGSSSAGAEPATTRIQLPGHSRR